MSKRRRRRRKNKALPEEVSQIVLDMPWGLSAILPDEFELYIERENTPPQKYFLEKKLWLPIKGDVILPTIAAIRYYTAEYLMNHANGGDDYE